MATPVAEDRAAALLEIVTLIAREAPDDIVFATVAEHVAHHFGTEVGSVVRYVGDERAVIVGVSRDGGIRGFPVNAELDFDPRNSVSGRIRRTRQPARLDSYEELTGELPLMMRASDLRSTVAAPVLVDDEIWGLVAASTSRTQALPANCEHQLVAFAELVALAVTQANARGHAAASRMRLVEAADETRRRLERELHEGAQQHLLALTLKLRLARSRADEDSEAARLIDDALAEAAVANTTLRELARGLYPIMLSERGLAVTVQALAARAPVAVHLRELPKRRFSKLAEATAYFAIVELIAAASAQVALTVGDRGSHVFVEVAHTAAADMPPGLADRVAAVGGQLQTAAQPGGGTLVRIELPV
jgi:signal transduction histidine kinase